MCDASIGFVTEKLYKCFEFQNNRNGSTAVDIDDVNVESNGKAPAENTLSFTKRNKFEQGVYNAQSGVSDFWKSNSTILIAIFLVVLGKLYLAYVIYSLVFVEFGSEESVRLLWMTILLYFGIAWYFFWKYFGEKIENAFEPCLAHIRPHSTLISW